MAILIATRDFFQAHALLSRPGIVAVSGGPDSVALGHVLNRLWQEGHFPQLSLAHLNHRLRGDESDADEAFVRSLPSLWQCPSLVVHSQQVEVAARARENGWSLEDAGRRARYSFLSDTARSCGAAWVATAHSADDQAETVLLRLLRGSGMQGLSAIPALRPLADNVLLVRPWLNLRRVDIRSYLADQNLSFREDASNRDARFMRNRVRHQLLPLLERDFQPALVPVLNRLAEQAGEVQHWLEEQAVALLKIAEKPPAPPVLVFDANLLAAAAPVLVRELFRWVWRREGWPQADMGWEEWNQFILVVQGKKKAADFPGRLRVRHQGRVVQIVPLGSST